MVGLLIALYFIALYSLRGGFSSQAHELVLPFFLGAICGALLRAGLCEVLPQRLEAQRPPDPGIMPQGPGEGTCALGACETFGCGVQVRPAAWCGAGRVGYDGPLARRVRPCDDPQQLTLGGSLPATDARADRSAFARRAVQLGNHRLITLPGRAPEG
jgi:hypothetical protein